MVPISKEVRVRRRSKSQLASTSVLPAVRPLMFELHIRPMFRTLDREHMSAAGSAPNLWKYNDLPAPQQQQFYELILNRLKSPDPNVVMPPPEEGGPWPAEWISLFERWISEGVRQLDKATVDISSLRAVRDPGALTVEITGSGTKPSSGHFVWIERSYDPDHLYSEYLPDEFVLYQEQRITSPLTVTPFSFDDFLEVPIGLPQLTVVDSAGKHVVKIT